MKLDVIAEVWAMMKESVIATDRDTVAENLVTILIDHDFSPSQIRSAFRDDPDVTTAIKYHVDDAVDLEEEFEDSDFEEYVDVDEEDYDEDY